MERRAIIFLDLDCFEVQVWLNKLKPDLIGKDVPIVVVNHDQRILSVNYTAKSLGVERHDSVSLSDARSHCEPKGENLIEIKAGKRFGKVDTFFPQTESDRIFEALQNYQDSLGQGSCSIKIERSSRDEFYIDVTDLIESYHKQNMNQNQNQNRDYLSKFKKPSRSDTFKLASSVKRNLNEKYFEKPTTIMETYESESIYGLKLFDRVEEGINSIGELEEITLVHGAIIAQKLIKIIKEETGYEASAGVAHSKLVAKLACSRNKPEGITIISDNSYERLQYIIEFQDLPGFGGRTGSKIKEYYEKKRKIKHGEITSIKEILRASQNGDNFECAFKELRIPNACKTSAKLFHFCYFRDSKPVVQFVHPKTYSTSISCKADSWSKLTEKIHELSMDMEERIMYNNYMGRRATKLVVKATMFHEENVQNPLANTMKLEEEPSYRKISFHIRNYLQQNMLHYKDISCISLIAKNIEED